MVTITNKDILNFLKEKNPNSSILESLIDKDYFIVETILGESNYGQFKIPIRRYDKIHIDTVRVQILSCS